MARLVRRPAAWDAALLLVIFLGGATLGARYVGAFQSKSVEEYGQAEFGAAVAYACGHGFVDPRGVPAVSAFLSRQRDTLSCSELPAGFRGVEPNFTQRLYRYLMMAVGLTWKVTGVSWTAMTPLFGLLFAITLCAAYGLFRLGAGPLLSALGVVPLTVSAHHLGMLPSLRDYAKAPFLLLLILVMARLALPPFSRARTVALSCLFGVVLGVGFGFRNDLLICVPPFVVVMAVLLPIDLRQEVRLKIGCAALAAVAFVATSWPILRGYGQGSNTGHVAVLGLTTPFDAPMGLTRPLYNIGTLYHDRVAGAIIGTAGTLHTGTFAAYLSPEYDREAVGITLGVVRHWPADIFVRAIASTLNIFDFPFTTGRFSAAVPPGIAGTAVEAPYAWQIGAMHLLIGLGPILAAAVFVVIGSSSIRGAVVVFLLTLYYCGYPAIQFHVRHFFHLEFVAWWALVFLLAAGARSIRARLRREPLRRPIRQRALGALATVALMTAVVVMPLWVLRAYQQRHVARLIAQLEGLPRMPATVVRTSDRDLAHIAVPGLWDTLVPGEVAMRYLAADFSAERCGAVDVPVRLKYKAKAPLTDYSSLRRVPIDARGPSRMFAPVYRDAEWAEFAELQMPAGYDGCLTSVSLVNGIGDLPAPMNVTLTPRAGETTWFQRLIRWEDTQMSPYPVVQALPAGLASPANAVPAAPPLAADYLSSGLAADGRGWKGVATAYVAQSRLLHFPEKDVPAGAVLRAAGVLRRGGLQIGILQHDAWVTMQTVDTTGPFTVLVQADRQGRYGVLVVDASPHAWRLEQVSLLHRLSRYVAPRLLQDDFELHDIAWVRPEA